MRLTIKFTVNVSQEETGPHNHVAPQEKREVLDAPLPAKPTQGGQREGQEGNKRGKDNFVQNILWCFCIDDLIQVKNQKDIQVIPKPDERVTLQQEVDGLKKLVG